MAKHSQSQRKIGRAKPSGDEAVLELSIPDLGRILKPLIVGDVVTGLEVRRAASGGIAVHFKDIDAGRFVPSFDLTLVMTASLADPRTIVCNLDMEGLAGGLLVMLKTLGGLPWLLKNFADPDAFSVSDEDEVLVHLDLLPEEMAEWLTERITITDVEVPDEGPIGARISFQINRFVAAEVEVERPRRTKAPAKRPV